MVHAPRGFVAILLTGALFASVQAATVTRQGADAFAQKVALIRQRGELGPHAGDRRTPVTQDEVNSWFAFRGQPHLPGGVMQPEVTIVGEGRVAGQAVVDLDAVAKRRATGGAFDPWAFIGGRVPVKVIGILHTRDGMGRLEIQSAEVSGVPVPPTLLQELVSFYSRSPERPQGVRLDETFALPANIRRIEVGQGQAVVVQ
ncbi:MAG: hypothetical protein A3I61_01795 [Acidobacteria bacterium RIFCSPLOWO2_02_FULL_68_18]|nr:MAG: hypothetical protein A3I61_01795 [Acidobacteria bacterium RIFCSPLOWO2_02_FULL_68_18]OFW50211.1 MAG: hypothetical protein A3G77_09575 [Acidobacteria bacterium RIFCSPLOWO2_12_FULL_68_19]